MPLLSADIPQDAAFTAGAAATMPVAWTYNVSDTANTGGVIATSPTWATRVGLSPRMTLTGRVPVGMAGLKLTVAYTYLDAALAVIGTGTLDTFTATTSTAARTLTPPAPPAAARWWFVQLVLNEGVSEVVQRTNLFPNPRMGAFSYFSARVSATWNASVGSTSVGIANLTNYVGNSCNTAGTGTYRGIDLFQPVDAASPSYGGQWLAVTPGDTLTLSCYVRSTKAATFAAAVRFFTTGGAWSAAATSGSSVALSANTWTRVTVTATVPAGAACMCASVWVPASTAWTTSDEIDLTGVLIEKAATAGTYFDGTWTAGTGYTARWNGSANASSSDLYTPGEARNRSLVLTNVTASAQAEAAEIVGAALTRPLRRSVYDALNVAAPQIAVGTPGLLAGSITYLCHSLEDALAVDAVYQFAGAVTLTTGTGEALDGFAHMAVEQVRLTAERALAGKPAKWSVQAEVREVRAT